MRPTIPMSQLLCRISALKTLPSFANKNARDFLDTNSKGVLTPDGCKLIHASVVGKVFYTSASDNSQDDRAAYQRTYTANDYEPTPNVRMKAYRRQALQNRSNIEFAEEANVIDLDPAKLLQKGAPNTMQGIIKDVMPVGYFVTLPNGREGYLPAMELGITGGLGLLARLFKVGQEITVRITARGGGGREILDIKPETYIIKKPGGFRSFTGRK